MPRKTTEIPILQDIVTAPPDMSDLAARLRFTTKGRIWLDDQRMILIHVRAMAELRKELITQLGQAEASSLLFRIGLASGSADAAMVRKVRPHRTPFESFMVGPQLHTLEGIAGVDPVRLSFDIERGEYSGEFFWQDSSEAEAHLMVYDLSTEPSCWMQLGYASGYTSAFMGKPISFREFECRAMGHPRCRIVGKPEQEWKDSTNSAPVSVASLGTMTFGKGVVDTTADRLVGLSPAFITASRRLDVVAPTNTTVLILGETGVGKERFARRLHDIGPRANGPFVAVNCSAIPDELFEAELFGVVRGAYTGANDSRAGKFERANGGTLFLDEIGTMGKAAQAKLLRVLQERQIERVGASAPTDVDVRVIAATNSDLRADVASGTFRADLYYRVAVFPIRIPTLRERRADIPGLLEYFISKFGKLHGKTPAGLSARAVDALLDYEYPGNVRELENMVERAILLAGEGRVLDIAHFFEAEEELLPHYLLLDAAGTLRSEPAAPAEPSPLDDLVAKALDAGVPVDELEAKLLEAAVRRADGNLSLAAKSLGLTRPQLAYRFKKLAEE